MKPEEEIEDLQKRIAWLKDKQANCRHDWDEAIYDPEVIKEGYGLIQDGKGSDPHWSYTGYKDVNRPRWSRSCKHCGKKDYTYEQEPVIQSYKPKF